MKYGIGIIVITLLLTGGWYTISNNETSGSEVDKIAQSETEKLSIITSFYPLQFALERIVGDLGSVTNVGKGKDPHDFEPTTQNILAMQKADVVVLQGADFEPWGKDVVDRLIHDGVPVILATNGIELHEGGHYHENVHLEGEEYIEEDNGRHGYDLIDPHTWLDPLLFSQMVENITEEIVLIDPENALTYQENATALKIELAKIDNEYRARLTTCELDEVITSHDAFSYLAERYEFEVHSIAGLSTQDIPSATTLSELKERANEGISTILLEENSITAYGETLARETGLETLNINPIENATTNEDYFSLMRSNLDTFATALKCNG